MTISQITVTLFGMKNSVFRVIHDDQVVYVAETREEAQAYIDAHA